jgi:hypothetical protein
VTLQVIHMAQFDDLGDGEALALPRAMALLID